MLLRFIMVLLCNVYTMLSSRSPNQDTEMGSLPDDQPAPNGKAGSTLQQLMHTIVTSSATLWYGFRWLDAGSLTHMDLVWFSVATFGILLRLWCFRILGLHFTFGIGTRSGHRLIEHGPYRLLVHPSYTAQFMVTLGILEVLHVPIVVVVLICGYFLYVLRSRMQIEEDWLLKRFGSHYAAYRWVRWRLLPWIY